MAKIFDVANAFLAKEPMTLQKLQQITVRFVIKSLDVYGKNIIVDTTFEEGHLGIISPKLRDKYKSYGFEDIDVVEPYALSEQEQNMIDSVWATWGDLSGEELAAIMSSGVSGVFYLFATPPEVTITNLDWMPGTQYTCNDGHEYEVDCNGDSLDIKGTSTRITNLYDLRIIMSCLRFRKEEKNEDNRN